MNNSISNWGKWGAEDQRGTANYITPEVVLKATRLVKRGAVYPLAIPLKARAPRWPGRHENWHVATYFNLDGPGLGSAEDLLMIHTHGSTHIDALSHIVVDGKTYNGVAAGQAIDSTGARRNGIDSLGPLVTRGIMLDFPALHGIDHLEPDHVILPDEVEAAARRQNVAMESGDALLFRTGWLNVWSKDARVFNERQPGPSREVAIWAGQREIAIMGADNNAVEAYPLAEELSLHREFIRNQGGYLMELLDLEKLARDRVHEFMFIASPLNITRGLGSPLTPIAIC
jgi:kynurenine formamidase